MAEALPTAEGLAGHLLVLSILERDAEAARQGLVQQFDDLEPGVQDLVLAHVADLESALRSVSRHREIEGRLNVIEIVRRCGEVRLAYLLGGQLSTQHANLSQAAAEALLRLTESVVASGRDGADGAGEFREQAEMLSSVLGAGWASYGGHRRREVLLAVALLAPLRLDRLMERLLEERSAAGLALAELIRHVEEPVIRCSLLFWATVPTLGRAVTDALASPASGPHLADLLSQAHLLAVPSIRDAVEMVHASEHLVVRDVDMDRLDGRQVRAVPRWASAVCRDEAGHCAALQSVGASSDRLARLVALYRLTELSGTAASEAIAAFCFDADVRIARTALRELKRRQWPGRTRLMLQIAGSGPSSLGELIESELGSEMFERFFANWNQLPRQTRESAGRAVMKLNGQFHRQLAAKMTAGDARRRLRAIMMARQLTQETFFVPQLVRLADDPDPRVASAAVKALGEVDESNDATGALVSALDHNDDRVAANAVESLEQTDRLDGAREALVQLAVGGRNRSRANAIKALMHVSASEAVMALRRMLDDTDVRHRISALWVVERVLVEGLAQQVGDIARSDPDADVRNRALRVIRRLGRQAADDGAEEPVGAAAAIDADVSGLAPQEEGVPR